VRVERPEPAVAVLVLDPPHRKLPVLDLPLMRDLDRALEELAAPARRGELRGLVVTGREPLTFAAGADVEAIAGLTDLAEARRLIAFGQAVFQRLFELSRGGGGPLTVVCAAGGAVPGGAYELALACDRIVLAEHDKTRLGLPEVKLGIAPGWGGTQRLPRRLGLPAALEPILEGKLYPAKVALRRGLVDRLAWPELARQVAVEIAAGRRACPRRARGWRGWAIDRNPLAAALIGALARRRVRRASRGHYPNVLDALELALAAPRTPLASGLAREADAVARAAVSPLCKHLVGLFELAEDAKKLGRQPDSTSAPAVRSGAVIGAGVMGAAIASLMAEKGIHARLADVAPAALAAAEHAHRAEIAKLLARRRIERPAALAMGDRLSTAADGSGMRRAELVLEAVAERLDVKRAVLAKLAAEVASDCILATNTSSLSVDEIARGLPHPERVVGIHFFNPVRAMPLVEIVRGTATSDLVVARAARFALDLGKTPVVVKDVAGFLVNRILGPYLDEALRLYDAGVEPERIERAAVGFGMPMGPLELVDEVGLDIAGHAGATLAAAYGPRMALSGILGGLVASKELGKKSGRGIFVWERRRGRFRRTGLNPRLPAPASRAAGALSDADVGDRLILAMVAEASRALAEGVVAGPRELDLASVFGTGFAPFRGGLWRYVETRGRDAVRARLAELARHPDVAARPGGPERFGAGAAL
jgi:3-hydroxyacyl-CoA dehydrogenase/enoyl-CoA hydratase/3-hydroxybutyryl-CoA epimerase